MKKTTRQERKATAKFMQYLGVAPLQFDSVKREKEKRKRRQFRRKP